MINPGCQLKRRDLLKLGIGLGAFSSAAGVWQSASAGDVIADLRSPSERLKAQVKLLGSLAKSVVYVSFSGTLWGVAPAREPVAICGFQGLARANWTPQKNGSFLQQSFDIGFFSDLQTGEPLEQLVNPLTGETVAPFHYKYGGGEATQHTEETAGENWTRLGKQVWLTERNSGEFPAPFSPTDWPRESAGETYFYGSETNYATTIDELSNDSVTCADYTLFWSSFLSWEPWLLMDGAPGFVMWRGIGAKLRDPADTPQQMRDYIASQQPNYFDKGNPWEGRASTYESFKQKRKPATHETLP